jgi:hypothetical protein
LNYNGEKPVNDRRPVSFTDTLPSVTGHAAIVVNDPAPAVPDRSPVSFTHKKARAINAVSGVVNDVNDVADGERVVRETQIVGPSVVIWLPEEPVGESDV